jgi:hypothetical protein
MKQKLIELKGEKDKSTTIVDNFNSPFTTVELVGRKHQQYRKTKQHYQPKVNHPRLFFMIGSRV